MAGGNKEAEGAAGKQQAQKPPVQRRRLFGSRSNGPKFGDKPKPKQEQKETAQAVEEEVK